MYRDRPLSLIKIDICPWFEKVTAMVSIAKNSGEWLHIYMAKEWLFPVKNITWKTIGSVCTMFNIYHVCHFCHYILIISFKRDALELFQSCCLRRSEMKIKRHRWSTRNYCTILRPVRRNSRTTPFCLAYLAWGQLFGSLFGSAKLSCECVSRPLACSAVLVYI